MACNTEGWELPWDLQRADKVVVGRISNYRLVANYAEAIGGKNLIERNFATPYERTLYGEEVTQGLPPDRMYGLFDLTVREVLKGRSARKIRVILPYDVWLGQSANPPSMVPRTLPDQDALIGLQSRPTTHGDLSLPRVVTDGCRGVMLVKVDHKADNSWLHRARAFFRSKRKRT
jgi:hypothetical protein